MELLEQLEKNAELHPDRIAVMNYSQEEDNLTYMQLKLYSDALAKHINRVEKRKGGTERIKSPVVVYGHKNPYMIVTFLACVKAGYPYCPVDISNPYERVIDIINEVNPSFVFALEELPFENANIVALNEIKRICNSKALEECNLKNVLNEDVFYILFTSGSTGKPKGVEITYDCLNHFLYWSSEIVNRFKIDDLVFINQAPFSFDLSVMDLYTNLYMGGTLYMIDKEVQMSFPHLLPALSQSNASVWVSTPSFADLCLSDKKFSQELLPQLKVFLFCGEVLRNATALKLIERFPEAQIINTFGPTETTVAVTEQVITKELAQQKQALPIGKAKPGTEIEIWDENFHRLRNNNVGEIVIIGNTVAKGYFNNPIETEKVFIKAIKNGKEYKAYRTGDKGYIDNNGVLHYSGRIDKQIKLNGYRIEIGDIEKNLLKLEAISNAVVLPKFKDDKVKSLTAFVTLHAAKDQEREDIKIIKRQLKELIPEYMIPKKIKILRIMPMNNNGKVDRKKLEGLL